MLLIFYDAAEGFDKKRDYISLLTKEISWPVGRVNKLVCFQEFLL